MVYSFLPTNIFTWIILGLVAGFIVHLFDYQNVSKGLIGTLLTGVLGALLGGVLANIFLGFGVTGFSLASLAIAVIAGLILTVIQREIYSKKYERGVDDSASLTGDLNYDRAYYSQVTPIGGYYGERKKAKEADQIWLERFLETLNYPISKRDLIMFAESKDANRKILS